MTKRIWISLALGWLAGGVVFALFFHKPLEFMAPVVGFLITFGALQVIP